MKENETKRCGRCKQDLPLTAFGPDKITPTGLKCYCRKCQVAKQQEYAVRPEIKKRKAQYDKAYRLANLERITARQTARRQTPQGRARSRRASREYRLTPKGKAIQVAAQRRWSQSAQGRQWREVHRPAFVAVARALRAKKLIRPSSCEDCGLKRRLEAHHHLGYAPAHHLDVRWLCARCHKAVHAKPALQAAC